MEELIKKIETLIETNTSSKYPHIKYCISEPDPCTKQILKQHFRSTHFNHQFTEILISTNPLKITLTNSKIYIAGKYSKMSRVLSQTPFKYTPYALSDFIIYFKKHYNADSVNFIGCGREDVDVICYERPFLLEIINPKNNLEKHVVDVKFHEGVRIFDLLLVTKEYRDFFVNQECIKTYKAIVASDRFSGNIQKGKYCIKQKTPIRVLHRRTNMGRERNLEILNVNIGIDIIDVLIRADAGTYIKEFVSGDFGRTVPSLTEINGHFCLCAGLDVIKIECEQIDTKDVLGEVSINIIEQND